jgi:hypothetical protein
MNGKWKSWFASSPFSTQAISRGVEGIEELGDVFVAWANRTQYHPDGVCERE